uniref:Serine/threonine kinase n=1 Tax=Karlodinium veneficum TaxID=407301 RepID=A7YXW3_KARVE|nr:serine/threonine kinase [Karlodinium veneficum]
MSAASQAVERHARQMQKQAPKSDDRADRGKRRSRSRSCRANNGSSHRGAQEAAKSSEDLGGMATPSEKNNSSSYEYYSEYTVTSEENQKQAKKEDKKEDIVHFDWKADMLLDGRYRVLQLLGDGTFGRVLLAMDERRDRQVAIKVIRDVEKYRRCAKREAELLADIREADPDETSRCVHLHGKFLHDGRFFCLVSEVLGASLYDVLKHNRYRGFYMQDIQTIMKECLEALSFLHDKLHMTHTDLKLENVLFAHEAVRPATFPREDKQASSRHRNQQYVRPVRAAIKLIDFGNATYDDDHHSSVINTRQYRGPEVVLQVGWNQRSDLWSMGCILLETYTGELLFRTHANLEHLALMEKIIAPLPQYMFDDASTLAKQECLVEDRGHWELRRSELMSDAAASKKLRTVKPLADLVLHEHRSLVQCAALILRPEPNERPPATEVLKHPFFSAQFSD